MRFRVNDVKKYQSCPRKFMLERQKEETPFPFVYFCESLVEAASKYLKLDKEECFVGVPNQSSADSLLGMKDKKWAYNARFENHDLRVKVSFLKKREDEGYDYYYLCSTCFPKEDEVKKIYLNRYVMEQEGIVIKHVELLHLNNEYVRHGDLDYEALFKTSVCFYKDNNKPGKNVDEVLEAMEMDVEATLLAMSKVVESNEIMPADFSLECNRRGKCDYYYDCFESDLSDDSILFLNGTRKKYEMFKAGKLKMSDVEMGEDVDGTFLQYAQIQSSLTGEEFLDLNASLEFLSTLEYPYTYLDFEWDTIGIPMYEMMKPYDVLLFQYSMHIDSGKGIKHIEFLGDGGDDRLEFIKSLLANTPKKGSIIAYHGDGAEKLRLQELAIAYPEYESELRQIWERMVDLAYPVLNGIYYHPKMRGTFSLKQVYEVVSGQSYHDLDIDHGLKAVDAYRKMETYENKSEIRQQLFDYCGLDTYSMIVFVNHLKELSAERLEKYRGGK